MLGGIKHLKRYWYFAIIFVAIIVALIFFTNIKKETPVASADVKVSAITGGAQFRHTNDGEKQPLAVGQSLAESDIISTDAGSLVVVALEEGKEIHIGENTIFALSAIRRDATGNVNILALKQGSIVNIVDTPLAESDVYEVHTPRLVMSVRGTSNYMESTEAGDTVIGITGQTHVFSDGGAANIIPGMMAELGSDTESLQLLPIASEDLPPLASNHANDRGISYDPLTQDAIEQSQQGADDFSPSKNFSNDFVNNLFSDDSISISGVNNSDNAPASDADSASSSESASSVPESSSESSSQASSEESESAVSESAPIQPVAVAQTPSSSAPETNSTPTESSSKADSSTSSSSSSSSSSNDIGSYSSNSSSYRSSGSSSKKSSSSSKPTTPTPPTPKGKYITIVYKDCFTGTVYRTDNNEYIKADSSGKINLTTDRLELPDKCYLSSSINGSSWLGSHGNTFPISVDSVGIVTVYVFKSDNIINSDKEIKALFYPTNSKTPLASPVSTGISLVGLATDKGIDTDLLYTAVEGALHNLYSHPGGRDIVGGYITLGMLFIQGKAPSPTDFPTDAGPNETLCMWVPVTGTDNTATSATTAAFAEFLIDEDPVDEDPVDEDTAGGDPIGNDIVPEDLIAKDPIAGNPDEDEPADDELDEDDEPVEDDPVEDDEPVEDDPVEDDEPVEDDPDE